MDSIKLKKEFIKKGYSVPKMAAAIGISKKALYEKLAGKTNFNQKEILQITKILELSDDDLCRLFFADFVS